MILVALSVGVAAVPAVGAGEIERRVSGVHTFEDCAAPWPKICDLEPFGTSPPAWSVVQDPTCASGTYCARSADPGPDGSSDLFLEMQVAASAVLAYRVRLDVDDPDDCLVLSIDGQEADRVCGDTAWTLRAVPVAPGSRDLAWTFQDAEDPSEEADAAWLDDVAIPGSPNLTDP